jgi:hypothetical protein
MATKRKLSVPLPIFGLDFSKPGEYVASQATTNGKNIRIRKATIEKRPGTESAGTSLGERIQELAELDTGSAYFFTRIGPTKFEEFNKTTLAWTNRANTALTGGVADQVSYAFPLISGTRIMVYTNGVDAIRKYTGGGNDATLGGSPPLAKYVIFFNNLLLLLNVTDSGNRFPWRVQWSDIGDPEEYDALTTNAGAADLLEDSGDITGGGILSQFVTIHKENAIYIGQATNTADVLRFERRETGAGAVAHRTIQSLPTGEQFFLGRDGFRLFNGMTAPLLESPVNDEIRETMNPTYAYKSWSKVIKELDEVWCGVVIGSDTEPSTIYKYNYATRQVHKDERTNITAVGEYKNTVGQIAWNDLPYTWDSWVGPWNSLALASLNPVYVFGFSSGAVTKQNAGSSDNGTAIDAEWDSKDFSSVDYQMDPNLLMRWQGAHVWAKGSGTAEIFYSIDGGSSWSSAGTITLTSDYPNDYAPQVVYFDALSTRCRIRLEHNTDAQTFAMKQFSLVAVPREAVFTG